jgi:hypothetical protein
MSWSAHLPIVPIVLPLAAGALMLLLDERRERLKAAISLVAPAAAAGRRRSRCCAVADGPLATVYALGSWPAPFGIVLVADRLAGRRWCCSPVRSASPRRCSRSRAGSAPGRAFTRCCSSC